MIRVMLDTDVLADLDGHAELLATYSDLVTDYHALAAKFPASKLLLIDRGLGDPTGTASILDVERGARTVDSIAPWLDDRAKNNIEYPTIYHDRSSSAAVKAAAGSRPHFNWMATLDGTCHIDGYPPLHAPAAVQILGAASVGIHADLSIVLEDGWNPTRGGSIAPAVKRETDHLTGVAKSLATGMANLSALIGG